MSLPAHTLSSLPWFEFHGVGLGVVGTPCFSYCPGRFRRAALSSVKVHLYCFQTGPLIGSLMRQSRLHQEKKRLFLLEQLHSYIKFFTVIDSFL